MTQTQTLLSLMPGFGKWLDVGVGIRHHGIFDYLLSYGVYQRVVGLDCFAPAVEARQKQYPQHTFLRTKVEHYHFTEQFDVITMLHVLEHLSQEDAATVLYRARRVSPLVLVESPMKFEDGSGAVAEMKNPQQRHQFLVTEDWMLEQYFSLHDSYNNNALYIHRG